MFPPDTKELVIQAHDRFLKQLGNNPKKESIFTNLSDEEQREIEKTKLMMKFVRNLVADVVAENNRLWVEALREKGIDL